MGWRSQRSFGHDQAVVTLPLAGLLVTAGFVLFCVPLGVFTWYSQRSQRLWLATGVWALSVFGLIVVTALIIVNRADSDFSVEWYSARFMLYSVSLLSFAWVLQEMSGRWQWRLSAALTLLVVLRAVLWFTTDLVWTHSLDAAGELVYGPGRLLSIMVGLLALVLAIRAVSKPWPTPQTRVVAAVVLIPTVVVTTALGALPSGVSDYTSAFLNAIPIVVVQAYLLYRYSVDARRGRELQRREGLLAEFGTRALEVGGGPPAQDAVDLLVKAIGADRCEYAEVVTDSLVPVATAGLERDEVVDTRFGAPIQVDGRTVGQLLVWGELGADDQIYIQSVAFVLSAATSRSAMEAEARERALHHPLTGLPNWLLLKDRLNQLIVRRQHRSVAMLCIDVVDMKSINDEFGHNVGDEVLRTIAHRLRAATDSRATVAHIGADEFAVAQIVDDRAQSAILSSRISAIGHEPLQFGGRSVRFSVRVGVALAKDAPPDADRFIRDAEMALTQAKKAAAPLVSYDERARAEVVAARRLAQGLRDAIRNDEFFVEYQPIVEIATGRVVGVEALARWRTSDGELIPPGDFIPVAEQQGMIMVITRRVFTQAMSQLAHWDEQRVGMRKMRLSLNLTPRVVGAPDLIPWLKELMSENQIAPDRITLELTESALVTAPDTIVDKVTQLHDFGIKISLDDFGTGYSTLNRLMKLPVSELKIDRSFTQSDEDTHRAIVPGIIRLARDSGLGVVAEGIETPEQWAAMKSDGVDLGQGYLFSRPVGADLIPDVVRASEDLAGHNSGGSHSASGLDSRGGD